MYIRPSEAGYVLVWRSLYGVRALRYFDSPTQIKGYAARHIALDERDDFRVWRPQYPWPQGLYPLEL